MSKGKQRKRNNYNEDAIRILHERHGYTKNYIRMSLAGDRVGLMPERMVKEYNEMVKASKLAIEKTAQKQNQE